MIKKKIKLLFVFVLVFCSFAKAQIPSGYYDAAAGLSGTALQQALHDIIDNHNEQIYAAIWTHFQTTDKKANGDVWDMYSDIPGATPPYTFTFNTDQCGTYQNEGDCYNREHSFPKSWFDEGSPMQTDLFHIYPTDGDVNGQRANYPYGEADGYAVTTLNGSKIGYNTTPGFTGTVFEPIDEYKGDFARTYFYMATRYYNEDAGWTGSLMVDGAEPKPWALEMLKHWHINDTVSTKERNRNNVVYGIQNNRNPFIDYPEWVEEIWGAPTTTIIEEKEEAFFVYPNPSSDAFFIKNIKKQSILFLYDTKGSLLYSQTLAASKEPQQIKHSLPEGVYICKILTENTISFTLKLIVL
jgi:endonuclease I